MLITASNMSCVTCGHRYTLHIQLLKDFADFSPLFDWLLIFTFTPLKCKSYLSPTPLISQCSHNHAIKAAEKSCVWLELCGPSNEQSSNASSFIRVIHFPAVFDVIRCTNNDHAYGLTQTMWAPRAQGRAESAAIVTTLINSTCDRKKFDIR